jgi:hypothetical protein
MGDKLFAQVFKCIVSACLQWTIKRIARTVQRHNAARKNANILNPIYRTKTVINHLIRCCLRKNYAPAVTGKTANCWLFKCLLSYHIGVDEEHLRTKSCNHSTCPITPQLGSFSGSIQHDQSFSWE